PRGEITAAGRGAIAPGQRTRPARDELGAEQRDRAPPGRSDVAKRPPLGLRAPRCLDTDALPAELIECAVPEVVVAERREELRGARELRELHRGVGSSTGSLRPGLEHVRDLAGPRDALRTQTLVPLD